MSRIFLSSVFLFSWARRSYWFFSRSSTTISYFSDNTWSLRFIHTAISLSLWRLISCLRSKMTASWCLRTTPKRMFIPIKSSKHLKTTSLIPRILAHTTTQSSQLHELSDQSPIRQHSSYWIVNPCGRPICLNNRLLGLWPLVLEFVMFCFQLLWS